MVNVIKLSIIMLSVGVPLEVPWGLVATAGKKSILCLFVLFLKKLEKTSFFLAQCYKTFFTGVKDITKTQGL